MSLNPSLTTDETADNPGQADEIGALTLRVATLEGDTLDARLDVLEGQTLDGRITAIEDLTLDSRLDALEGQTLDARLGILEGQSLDTRLDTMEGYNLQSRVAIIEAQTLDARLDIVEGQNLDSRTTVLEDQLLDSRLDTLEGQTLDARLDVVEGQLLNTRLTALEGQTLDARLDALEALTINSRLLALESDVATINSTLATHAARLTALEAIFPSQSNEFLITDYGAACDGETDDLQAWLDAVEAAEEVDGVVVHPGGVSCVTGEIRPTDNSSISFVGGPGAILRAHPEAAPFDNLIRIESVLGGVGSRYGAVRNLRLDGNDIAIGGLRIQTVNRIYDNVNITKCTSYGCLNAGGQNNLLINCTFDDNGTTGSRDANYRMDLGSWNNVHVNMQLSMASGTPTDRGVYNLVICQSDWEDMDVSGEVNSGFAPSYNKFYGCQFERTATSSLAAILQSAGSFNLIDGGQIQCTGHPTIVINSDDGIASQGLIFRDCNFSSNTSVLRAERTEDFADGPAAIFIGANTNDNAPKILQLNDFSPVDCLNPIYHGGTLFENIGATSGTPGDPGVDGGKTVHGLVRQHLLRLDGVPSNTTGVPIGYPNQVAMLYNGGSGEQDWYSYQGAWRKSDMT